MDTPNEQVSPLESTSKVETPVVGLDEELQSIDKEYAESHCFGAIYEAASLYASGYLRPPPLPNGLGKVRYALERCLHFKMNDGQENLIKEALSILDQQAEQSSPATSDAASCSSTNASLNRQADPEGTPERGRWLAAAVVDWQPIETAPKDGTEMLLFCEWGPFYQFVGFWAQDSWVEKGIGGAIMYPPQVTHWQPLPAAPPIFKSSAQRGGE